MERGTPRPSVPPWRVRPFLRPVRWLLATSLTLMLIGIALGLLQPILVQLLIDRVILEAREDRLWQFGAALLGAGLIRFGLGILQARLFAGLSTRVLLDLRLDFLAHLQRLPPRFFAGTRFGDIITRFNRDLSQLQEIATGALLGFITQSLTLVGAVAIGVALDARLFLLAAIPFPIALGLAFLFRRRVRRQTENLREHSQDLASTVTETILGMRTVRTFGREKGELARFAGVAHRLFREILGFQVTHALAGGLPRLCLLASTVTLYWVGGIRVIRGETTLGELVALGLYVTTAFGPLGSLVDLWLQLVGARVSLARVRAMRELPPSVGSSAPGENPGPVEGAISLEGVRFSYGPGRAVLDGVELEVASGERVAILGPSGTGKSTLVDLVLGFLDPDEGTVRIDGRDLRSLDRDRVRDHFGVVLSETFLFHGTVADNIRFGEPRAGRDRVAEAARLAGLGTDDGLPAGLDTPVGERGNQLSAGQRQRIGIARALVRRPAVLLLDEATSDLDPPTERGILERLAALPDRPTIIAVTHRPAVAAWAERSVRLSEGRIDRAVEPG